MNDIETVAAESNTATSTPPVKSVSAPRWTAVAWLLLGVLLGIVAIVAYTRLIGWPSAAPVSAPLDAAAIRNAAREGTLDAIATLQAGGSPAAIATLQAGGSPAAIATLQAGGSPAESRVTSTPVVVKTAFAARPANQIGNQDAPVTIVEFGDFQ